MSTALSAPKNTRTLPPKRGRVKAHIFGTMGKSIASIVSRAVQGRSGGGGETGGDGFNNLPPATPPSSSSNSDTNSD